MTPSFKFYERWRYDNSTGQNSGFAPPAAKRRPLCSNADMPLDLQTIHVGQGQGFME
jgi:hypothetical protein